MKLSLSLIFFLFSFMVFAQSPVGGNGQERPIVYVVGTVVEKETNQPLEYATIVLTPEKGQITGGLTDEKGKFEIAVPMGMYAISIEFLSFKTKTLPKQRINQNLNLGTIILESDSQTLAEVELIAEKSTVEIKLDKKIYNVGQDMTIKGGNAADVLENVPSVTVDVEGNVSLRGNESVRILIDGKPSGLVGLSATDALRQLPADAIAKVEVITSPSARYDAEGTAGIINIILRKGKVTGFNASYSVNLGLPENLGASANVNYRNKSFNIFSNFGYNYRNAPGEANFFNYIGTKDNKTSEEEREYFRKRQSFNGNLGMEYFLSDKASVTGSVLYRLAPNSTEAVSNSFKYDATQNVTLATSRTEDQSEDDDLIEYALNYTQKFSKDDHKWTIDLKYQDNNEDSKSDINDVSLFPTSGSLSKEINRTIEAQKEWLIKSDYVLPLGEKQQFEIGFQANIDKRDTDYQVSIFDGLNYVLDDDISNELVYDQNVLAVYSQYGKKINKLSALFGLRMESTQLKVDVIGTSLGFIKEYTKFFPTLNLAYELSSSENITLGYNRRIRRPHSRQINPFPSRSSSTNIFQGNPDLDPVVSDSYDVGYLKKWEKLTLNTSVYYSHASNAFQMVRELTGDTDINGIPVIRSTPINLNQENRIGTELSLNYSPKKKMQFNNSFNLFYYNTDGAHNGVDYSGENLSWNNRFSAKMIFFKKLDFQTTFMYEGPYENASQVREPIYSVNLAFSADVLNEKGTLSLNVSDLLNTRYRSMTTHYTSFDSFGKMQWQKRQINLNFTYRFNQKKKPVRTQTESGGGEEMM